MISSSALASKFLVKSDIHADGHYKEARGSVTPIKQSEVTAKNGKKRTASKYQVRNETLSDVEEQVDDISAICTIEQVSKKHSEEAELSVDHGNELANISVKSEAIASNEQFQDGLSEEAQNPVKSSQQSDILARNTQKIVARWLQDVTQPR